MLKIVDKISITADQARYYLEQQTSKGGIFIDLDRCLDYQAYYIEKTKPVLQAWRKMAGFSIHPDKKEDVKNTLINRFEIPESRLVSMGKISIAEEVLTSLVDSGDVSEEAELFIKIYQKLVGWLHRISYLEQYINNPLTVGESFEGHRMVIARPEWRVLSTSRISARGPSVQNLMKEFADIITYPPGYKMVYADSGQIEPRITWSYFLKDPVVKKLIELYNDAYFGQLHYITMSNEELKQSYVNPEAIEKKDLPREDRATLKLLGLAGTYGGGLENQDPRLANGYRRLIVNHPGRKELDEKVREAVRNGQETFYGAFGSPVTPDETQKYKKGTPGWYEHLVRCGINNPIQTTASELMCESVYQAVKILQTKAKSQWSHIGYYKHDENLCYLAPGDHDLEDELAECMSYDVTLNGERWIPIYSDKVVGKKKAYVAEGEEQVPEI